MELKNYEDLELTDNFMFCKVLTHHPELCRRFVELLIGQPVREIQFRDYEKTIMITPESKGIRMDVYMADEVGTVYDLEMQNSNRHNLPKRSRYYQGMIDLDSIESGAHYSSLPRTLIIFLCPFDYFHKNLPVYRFERRCEEFPELKMGDETAHIVVNLTAPTDDLAAESRALYYYLVEHEATDSFTDKLDAAVNAARSHNEWRVEYMNNRAYEMDHQDDLVMAREEGISQGIEIGRDQGIEIGRDQGINIGRSFLLKAIQLLRDGKTQDELLELGIPADIIADALSVQ